MIWDDDPLLYRCQGYVDLAPRRSGSAKKIRSGKARAAKALEDARKKPLWKRQLKHQKRKAAVTLASPERGDGK